MSEQKIILMQVHVNDDWTDGAEFVIIDTDLVEQARRYSEWFAKMKADGLTPYRISEFNYAGTYVDKLPRFSPEFAKSVIYAGDDDHIENAVANWEEEELPTVNSVEDIEKWLRHRANELEDYSVPRTECDMIDVYENGFRVKAYLKHTSVTMESEEFYYDDSRNPYRTVQEHINDETDMEERNV